MQITRHASLLGLTTLVALGLTTALSQPAAAQVTLDFSTLGTVFQDTTGVLYNTSGAGRTNVTTLFETDALTAAQYWNNAISIPGFTESINFTLADLSSESAVADSGVNSTDANGRPVTSTIRFDMGNGIANFLDPTPLDNSEFAISSRNATLGGGQVNVSRFGDANATAPGLAMSGYDALTVDLHEIEHSLGYASGLDRFLNLVGPTAPAGSPDRQLPVPTSLSGLPSGFNIPIVPTSAHIDGVVQNGLFNDTIVAEPGFNAGQRALPTDVEILGLGVIEGATANQIHLGGSPSPVPEASTTVSFGLLLALGLGGLVIARKRKKSGVKATAIA